MDIFSLEKYFCHEEISEILFVQRFRPVLLRLHFFFPVQTYQIKKTSTATGSMAKFMKGAPTSESTELRLPQDPSKFHSWRGHSTLQFSGGGHFRKACRSRKKNRKSRKSRSNSRNLLEPFLRSRKEENLYGYCAMSNARRILSKGSTLLRGCWFLVEKASFSKEFRWEFQCSGEGKPLHRIEIVTLSTALKFSSKFFCNNPEFVENWKLSFSGGYLRIRGTILSFQFQWDILLRTFAALKQQRGYRDSARLLGESCADKKWGATWEKNCTEIEK